MNRRSLLVWCGVSAWIGASLWVYKGVAILATGNQPDHAFEIAPFFFGMSVVALAHALIGDLRRPKWLILTLSWFAVSAGFVAAMAHFLTQEGVVGDIGYLVNFASTIIVLFLISGDIRRQGLLPRWSFIPTVLAWWLVLAIPIGGMFEEIDERYLEIPLIATSSVWTMLGVAVVGRDLPRQGSYPS